MQTGIRHLFGISMVSGALALALTTAPAHSAPKPKRAGIEKSLLGIRVLASYRDVLKAYGQPTRIYRVGEPVDVIEGTDARGRLTGGIRGLGGAGGGATLAGGGAPGRAAFAGGAPFGPPAGRGPAAGFGPPAGVGGLTGPPPQAMAAMMGMYGGRGPGGVPGGIPGASGSPFSGSGGSPFAGRAGGGVGNAALGGNRGQDSESPGGFVWVYFFPKEELLYRFTFNKDGRVEIIYQRGRVNSGGKLASAQGGSGAVRLRGPCTSRGVGLNSSVQSVYNAYDWPDRYQQDGPYLNLSYAQKAHVQFTLVNNRVTGIAVMLREDQSIITTEGGSTLASSGGGATPLGGARMPGGAFAPRGSFSPGGPPAFSGFPGGIGGGGRAAPLQRGNDDK